MDEPRSSNQEPLLRFIIACPRSGSILLMRVFAESLVCAVTSGLVLMGNTGSKKIFSPDYSIIETYPITASLSVQKLGQAVPHM